MKRVLHVIWAAISSRLMSPLIIGFFLIVYIAIAFGTDEALTVLMEFTRRSMLLTCLLALLPLNCACRIIAETRGYLRRRRALHGNAESLPADLFDEAVTLSAATPVIPQLQGRLVALRYKTRHTHNLLTAWKGASIFPVRILYLAGMFCLFAGILISLSSRVSHRRAVIEGEPFPFRAGDSGVVGRILLEKAPGPILANDLTIEVGGGEGMKAFGLYPPSIYRGAFVYPRYLGIGLIVGFSAPDLPGGYEKNIILAIYPPGKEATVEIPRSPYQLVLSLEKPDDGSDPYMTGRMSFLFKLVKAKEVVLTGSVPSGGEYVKDGYRLAFPDARRLVMTDFIRDNGVALIWSAAILFCLAGGCWLPVRLFVPRREMLFRYEQDSVQAVSRAEGKERKHGGVFHEMLDLLETGRIDTRALDA